MRSLCKHPLLPFASFSEWDQVHRSNTRGCFLLVFKVHGSQAVLRIANLPMVCFRSQPVFIFWKFIRSFLSLVHGHNTLCAGNGKKTNKQTAKAVAGAHCIYMVRRVGFLHGSSICGGVRTDASRETKEEEVRAERGGFRGLPAVLAAFTCCLKSNNSLFAARPRGPCSRLPFFPYLWQSLLQRKGVRETWVYVGSASGF